MLLRLRGIEVRPESIVLGAGTEVLVTALVSLSAGIGATAVLGLLGAAALWKWVPKGRPGYGRPDAGAAGPVSGPDLPPA